MNNKKIKGNTFIEDSYCGLYCGACEILLAYKKAMEHNTVADWDNLPEEFSDHINKAEVKCLGCKTDTVFAGCRRCQIRSCAREKGVEYCIDCECYPCELINQMKVRLEAVKNILPHTSAIIGNLKDIQKMGRKDWLKYQKELWSCPTCSARLSWYQRKCTQCNQKA